MEIDDILEELETVYSCNVKNKVQFKSDLFELCCQIAEYEGIKPRNSPIYVFALMCNYVSDIRDDIVEQYNLNPDTAFEITFNHRNIRKIAKEMYLERK